MKSKNISKNIVFIIIGLLVCLVAAFIMFGRVANDSSRFARDVVRGIISGWEDTSGEASLQETNGVKDVNFINYEYNAIMEYEDKEIKNIGTKKIYQQYKEALEGCRQVMNKYDPDKEYRIFWENFSKYYGQRIKALYELSRKNKVLFSEIKDKYPNEYDNIMINGWALLKTEGIKFKKGAQDEEYITSAINDSEYDIEYYNLEINLLDEKGKVVEKTEVYLDNWKTGEKRELKFFKTNKKATSYEIVAEVCGLANE